MPQKPAKIDIPANEQDRIKSLQSYFIVDTPPEEAFDNLAQIIAGDFDVPIALISFVDKHQVFFKANVGMSNITHADRQTSLCSLAILSDEPTVFENALEEPCLMANPNVYGGFGLRFYAGAPIITPDGHNIGTVCIIDKTSRTFSEKEEKRLTRYARLIMHEIAIRLGVKEKTEALEQEIKLRQKKVTEAVIRAQEMERTSISRDLHDNVNQVLTTIKLYNEMLLTRMADPKTILEKSSMYLQQCIDDIRSISKQLSAPSLGKIGIVDSIKELVSTINVDNELKIKYKLKSLKSEALPHEPHLAVYRIVQEHVTNIVKHSKASEAVIELQKNQFEYNLTITDNGVGFDTHAKNSSTGITNMRTRAENLNGTFILESKMGKGCRLSISFPANFPERVG